MGPVTLAKLEITRDDWTDEVTVYGSRTDGNAYVEGVLPFCGEEITLTPAETERGEEALMSLQAWTEGDW